MAEKRCAVITPYYKEDRWLLERCMRSVREQTAPADHILIADGFPQDWIDSEPVRHVRLDRNHSDFGNTPRGIGGLLAAAEGYHAIALLDADNWFEPGHVASCFEAAQRNLHCDYVVARRHLRRPDGSIIEMPDEPIWSHVDTSCYFLLPGSYHLLARFPLIPKPIGVLCDRIFFALLKEHGMIAEVVPHRTVNYHVLWPAIYKNAGEIAPMEADHTYKWKEIVQWLTSRRPREMQLIHRLCGPYPNDLLMRYKAQVAVSGEKAEKT